ncbi:MAG TPA: RNA 2',3'-cyclic phosphodiesterase [Planctomycetes bacterium]|nr:RNA 2',3'-cyclic phosphodiesterase [Planctomycetota bacterium]|tara:strand:- start:42 stop:611 length:570 start_codon:yes stop_codon:yes gene_type:complete
MTDRVFWAVEFPASIRAQLVAAQQALRAACEDAPVRWVRAEQLHLTLKFVGEVEDVGALVGAVQKAVHRTGALQLEVAGLGTSGKKAIWAGVGGPDAPRLAQLAATVDESLEALGVPREQQAFAPQVTLGRARGGRRPGRGVSALQPALSSLEVAPLPFLLEELVLYGSAQDQSGPAVYTALERVSLLG